MISLRRIPLLGRLAPVLLVLVATGCDSPTAPSYVSETWALEATGDASLPMGIIGSAYRIDVHADTIRLRLDGTGEHFRRMQARIPVEGEPVEVTMEFTYERHGARLEISYVCSPRAWCLEPPHIVGDVIDGTFRTDELAAGFRYRRL